MTKTRELAGMLADGPPLVYAAIKEVMRETQTMGEMEAITLVANRRFPTVDQLYSSDDQLEGARAFVEKRAPTWRGR
jgi:crotonobetainyl-CoA hydratase